MRHFGPRALTPHDGLGWLKQALHLLLQRPGPFLAVALLAPVGSALLLTLPLWDAVMPIARDWLPVIATVVCYGLPQAVTVSLACAVARAVNRQRSLPAKQLLVPTTFRILLRSSLFLFILLLHGYFAAYLVQDFIDPMSLMNTTKSNHSSFNPFFGITDSVLGTQLNMIGALLLVLQFMFAIFVAPLYLFREMPFYTCWRLSFLAMQLNPWLLPSLGLPGVALILLSYFKTFSVLAQVLALPLPAYLGALLYIAWLEVFHDGLEDPIELPEKPVIPEIRCSSE